MPFISRRHVWQLVSLLVADGVVFGLTNAQSVPSPVIIIGFLLLTATMYYIIYGLLTFASLYGLSIRHQQRLAGALTGLAGGLIALQSIGELSPRDVMVILPLAVLGYLYSAYAKTTKGQPRV